MYQFIQLQAVKWTDFPFSLQRTIELCCAHRAYFSFASFQQSTTVSEVNIRRYSTPQCGWLLLWPISTLKNWKSFHQRCEKLHSKSRIVRPTQALSRQECMVGRQRHESWYQAWRAGCLLADVPYNFFNAAQSSWNIVWAFLHLSQQAKNNRFTERLATL